MKIEVIEPHGFCAGVRGALERARRLLSETEDPVYCLHELVHNEGVTGALAAQGLRFVENVDDVPEGARVLFSAHGVSPAVRRRAAERHLRVTDTTCPFVTRVHRAAKAFSDRGLPVVIIGHRGHAEANGIVGECAVSSFDGEAGMPPPGTRIGVVAQTTMHADDVTARIAALRETYDVEAEDTVCRATKERQDAVRDWIRRRRADGGAAVGVLVLGSARSSNTRRLVEIAAEEGVAAWRAGSPEEVKEVPSAACDVLGVTSGASTPEAFFLSAIRWLRGE